MSDANAETSLFSYYGGKGVTAPRIVEHFPVGPTLYLEPFFGSGAVFFAVPQGVYRTQVVNDLNRGIVTFFKILRERPKDLLRVCSLSPYAFDEQRDCRNGEEDPPEDELETARRVWVRQSQNFGGRNTPVAGWKRTHPKKGGGEAETVLAKLQHLEAYARRMMQVEINNLDVLKLLEAYAGPEVFAYLDPPYHPDALGEGGTYQFEMSHAQHVELLNKVQELSLQGTKFALSGYPCALYNERLKDWRRIDYEVSVGSAAFAAEEKRKRTEVLWMNYPEHLELRRNWSGAVKATTPKEKALLKHFKKAALVR